MAMVNIDLVHIPAAVSEAIRECESCEEQRRPRVWICDYHSGYWAGYEDARETAGPIPTNESRSA